MPTIVGTDGQNLFWNDEVKGLQKTPLTSAIGTTNFNGLTNQPGVFAQAFGVTANTRWTGDGSITLNSPTVTSASINFTASDVGKTIYTVYPSTGQTKLIGTILSVQSSTQATASANASATQSNCSLCVGTDDTAALQAAWAACLAAGGAMLFLPSGAMLVSAQPFYYSNGSTASPIGAFGLQGQGGYGSGTVFVVSPSFNFGSMHGSGMIYDVVSGVSGDYDGFHMFNRVSQISVTGLGAGFGSQSGSGLSLLYGNSACFSDIQIAGFSGPAYMSCVTLNTESRAYNLNIQPQFSSGLGNPVNCLAIANGADSIDIYAPILAYTGGWGLVFENNTNVNIFGGLITSTGGGPGSNPHTGVSVIGSTGVNFFGTRINAANTGGATPGGIYVDGTSEVFLSGVEILNGITSSTNIWVASGGQLSLQNVNNVVTGSAAGLNIAGSLYDLGGNIFGQTPTISGSIFGDASITGTVQVAGNITPGTGWGTTGAAGNGVSSVSGNTKIIQFTITTAGTPGASPTVAIVFPTPFLVAPIVSLQQVGGTGTSISNPIASSITTMGATFTFTGTPSAAGATYILQMTAGLS